MNESDNTDDKLLQQKACAGDQTALTDLLAKSAHLVRNSIRGKINARWNSVLSEDDIMQQTYADAFLGIRQFQGTFLSDFSRWLSTLAANNLRDAVRQLSAEKRGGKMKRMNNSPEHSSLNLWDNLADSISTPSIRARRGEAHGLLGEAIAPLPEAYRQVVVQYDLEERNAEEVAGNQQCSTGAMYMRRSRAHDMLAELLSSQSRIM